MYADDTTVLAADINSVNIAISYFELFCSASGATLNLSKCEACVVCGVVDLNKWPKWLKLVKSLKICGVFFGEEAQKLNEENLQNKIEKTFNTLKTREITYFGKAILINVLVLSKLWYIATVCVFTNAFFKWLEKQIFSFAWKNVDRLERLAVIKPLKDGGLNLVHPGQKCRAIRIKHITTFISSKKLWSSCTAYLCALPLHKLVPKVWSNMQLHSLDLPHFYTSTVEDFKRLWPILNNCIEKGNLKTIYEHLVLEISVPAKIETTRSDVTLKYIWYKIQKFPLSPEPKNFLWQVSHGIVQTKDTLFKMRLVKDNLCPSCDSHEETIEHCLLACGAVKEALHYARLVSDNLTTTMSHQSLLDLENLSPIIAMDSYKAVIYSEFFYAAWLTRNDHLFRGKPRNNLTVKQLVLYRVRSRIKADFIRLPEATFRESCLGKPLPITLLNENLILGF
jgi:zinc-binding in reverse transcriptase